MTKLLNAFIAAPTEANRVKLTKYLRSHMMAVCMATEAEYAALKQHGFLTDA
jgi:hypothetical protein